MQLQKRNEACFREMTWKDLQDTLSSEKAKCKRISIACYLSCKTEEDIRIYMSPHFYKKKYSKDRSRNYYLMFNL